jgi:hypothetical protein
MKQPATTALPASAMNLWRRGGWLPICIVLTAIRSACICRLISPSFLRGWFWYLGPTAYQVKRGYPAHGYVYFKMGLYRDEMPQPMTIYVDEYRKDELSR